MRIGRDRFLITPTATSKAEITESDLVVVDGSGKVVEGTKKAPGETELHLTSLEQSLLYLLAANAGRLLTRDEILDYLWGIDYVAESNVVDRHIRNLRIKLQNHSRRPRYIATVPGRGYRFIPTAPSIPPS